MSFFEEKNEMNRSVIKGQLDRQRDKLKNRIARRREKSLNKSYAKIRGKSSLLTREKAPIVSKKKNLNREFNKF